MYITDAEGNIEGLNTSMLLADFFSFTNEGVLIKPDGLNNYSVAISNRKYRNDVKNNDSV